MEKKIKNGTRVRASLIAVCVALTVSIGILGTVAYLFNISGSVTNKFQVASLPNDVVETFDGTTKQNVTIKNTSASSKAAYIRVAVVVNWAKADDGTKVHGSLPVEGEDYTIEWNLGKKSDGSYGVAGDWYKGTDGYYYFDMPVDAGKQTQYLIKTCKRTANADVPDGYVLSVTIMSQSIQTDGVDSSGQRPVILAWGTAAGGSVKSVNSSTKALTIAQ